MRPEVEDPNKENFNRHADLLLLRHGTKIYVDVLVTRPTKASILHNRSLAHSSSVTPLVSTRGPASQKHYKYDAIAEANGYRMVPFVMETYGGVGREGTTLLHVLASHCKRYSKEAFLSHARKRLSVTLQSANANLSQLAMQGFLLREHSHSNARGVYDWRQQQRDKHNAKLSLPEDGDRLARRVSLCVAVAAAEAEAEEADAGAGSPLDFTHDQRLAFADRTVTMAITAEVAA